MKSGGLLLLEAELTAEPKAETEWTKDGTLIESSERIEIKTIKNCHRLKIKDAVVSDAGEYTIKAQNKLGVVESHCHVVVTEIPKLLKELESIEIKQGEAAEFSVQISGSPKPDLQWFLNGKQVESKEGYEIRIEDDVAFLAIGSCDLEDAGEIRCVVSNIVGDVSSNANLVVIKVETAPEIQGEVELDKKGMEGDDVTFDLKFSGDNVSCRW